MLHLIQARKQKESGKSNKKNIVKNNDCSKVRYSRGTVDKSRDNTSFQGIGFFEYCSKSKKFLIFLEKVYTFRSLRFCGTDFHRSIALNEIICLPVFVLTRALYKFFCVAYLVL